MFDHGFPPEWSTLKKLVWLVGSGIAGAAAGIWKTVSGSLIHITDALAAPMQKCEVTLEPIQDLHGQDAPYPAGGGSNKFGANENPEQDKYINANGTIVDGSNWIVSDYIAVDPNTQYTFNPNSTYGDAASYAFYNASKGLLSVIESYTVLVTNNGHFTTPSDCYFMRFSYRNSSTDIMLNLGSTALPFEPYSNICPITGWTGCEVTRTGKNLLDFDALKTYSNWKEDIATTAGEGGATSSVNKGFIIPTKAGYKYTISFDFSNEFPEYLYICKAVGNVGTLIAYLTTNEVRNSSYTFTADDCIHYLRMGATLTEGQFDGQKAKIHSPQLELGSTATSYEPYSGTTLSVTFPDGQTVYGGKYEFIEGVGESRLASVDLGTLNWNKYTQGGTWIFYANVPNGRTRVSGGSVALLCSCYKCSSTSKSGTEAREGDDKTASWDNTNSQIIIKDSSISGNADSFKVAMDGMQLVYELAEPITYQLTPQEISTLRGENNVWGDGNIEMTYKAQAE